MDIYSKRERVSNLRVGHLKREQLTFAVEWYIDLNRPLPKQLGNHVLGSRQGNLFWSPDGLCESQETSNIFSGVIWATTC